MKYLQDKNYNVISLDDFYKFKEEKNFPDDAAALEIEKEMAALDIKEFEKPTACCARLVKPCLC
jgi:uridine kinase